MVEEAHIKYAGQTCRRTKQGTGAADESRAQCRQRRRTVCNASTHVLAWKSNANAMDGTRTTETAQTGGLSMESAYQRLIRAKGPSMG